jgi:uncharacterized integral membrane protein
VSTATLQFLCQVSGVPDTEQSSSQSGSVPAGSGDRQPLTPAQRRQRTRLITGGVIGAIVAAFALLNLDQVKVHWIVTTGRTPLIVVVVVAFLLGVGFDRLVIRAQRKRRQGR